MEPSDKFTKHNENRFGKPKHLKTRRASNTPIMETRWAIPNLLPRGELTALAGPKATGKSTIYCSIAAAISNGSSYPSWLGSLNREPDGVLIMSSEDDFERTIIPRLKAAGANLERIEFVDGNNVEGIKSGSYKFAAEDNDRIATTIKNLGGVSLIVIDPWSLVIDGDARNKIKVRRKLEDLLQLAKQLDVAILIIGHVSKNAKGSDPITRFSGSSAVTEVSRSLFITARIENGPNDDGSTHVLVRAATNLGKVEGGFSYSIKGTDAVGNGLSIPTSKIVWHAELEGLPEDILNDAEKSNKEKKISAPEEAAIFLRKFLRNEPRSYPDITNEAAKFGIAKSALERAKKTLLTIKSSKQMGAGSNSPFIWTLISNSGNLGAMDSEESLSEE